FLSMGKDGPSPTHIYAEYFILRPLFILGLRDVSIVTAYAIGNFVGVFFLIVAIYFFVLRLAGNKWLAAATALFVIGGYTFFTQYPIRVSPFTDQINIYGRPLMPYFASLFFFLFLNFLLQSLDRSEKRYVWYSGLLFGALFYTYPYAWTFSMALLFTLGCAYGLQRNRTQLKKVVSIAMVGLVIGSPILVRISRIAQTQLGQQINYFSGILYDHSPAPFSKVVGVSLLLWLVFSMLHKDHPRRYIILCLLASGIIAMNQQILTGRIVQFLHYFWYFVIPLAIIADLSMFWIIFRALLPRSLQVIIFFTLLVLVYSNTIFRQYLAYFDTKSVKLYAQNYGPIIDILNEDKQPKTILSSDIFFGNIFSVYTNHDMYWSADAYATNTPLDRIKDAFFVYLRLNRLARRNTLEFLKNERNGRSNIFDAYHQSSITTDQSSKIFYHLESFLSGSSDAAEYSLLIANHDPGLLAKQEEVDRLLLEEYKINTKTEADFLSLLRRGNIAYIVWDKNLNPNWDLSVVPCLSLVKGFHNVFLYTVDWKNPVCAL
ncbi:MAG: hypothetical protein HY983_00895, partial [Candidatus Magasanikbacteria bacterium]|nr:hypothetical protein [Candidatus Magasanikbacteria bacterium]